MSAVISTDPAVMESRYQDALPLFEYDQAAPLGLERGESVDEVGYVREELGYASPKGGTVDAYLLHPEGDGPHPGLIVLHGSGGNRSDFLEQGGGYARLGVLVLLIDAPSARREGDFVNFTERDREEQIQLMVDLQRAVDVLVEVGADPDRIGFLGYSYGAAMGSQLAGIESRISAFVLDVGDGGLVSHFTGPDDFVLGPGIPDEQWNAWLAAMEPIEPIYSIGHAAAGTLLMQSARDDEAIPVPDAERWHEAAGDSQEVRWYESGHFLPDQAWCDQADWLRPRLGFAEGGPVAGCD